MAKKKKNAEPSEKKAPKRRGEEEAKSSPPPVSSESRPRIFCQTENDQNKNWSVILFALGVLIGLMALIPGTAGWKGIHNSMLGIFGVSVFFVPVILIYTSVLIGLERSQKNVTGRAVWGVALTFLSSAAIQIFGIGYLPGKGLGGHIAELFRQGEEMRGGGIASILIAGPLLTVFGGTGAKIISTLMFFVFILLLTGQGIIQFFENVARPFLFLAKCLAGLHCMVMGGEFDDGFYGYDEEDEEEDADEEEYEEEYHEQQRNDEYSGKSSFDEDMEAIEMVNRKNDPQKIPQKRKSLAAERREKEEFGLMFDIPIPAETPPMQENMPCVPQIHFQQENLPVIDIPLEEISPSKEKEIPVHEEENTDSELEQLINRAAVTKQQRDIAVAEENAVTEKEQVIETPEYVLPDIELLTPPDNRSNSADAAAEMREKADNIVNTLKSFGVEVKIRDIFRGPSITRYEIQPGSGVKVSKIKGFEDDIALNLAAQGIRIEAPVPGKPAVGIEVPNMCRDTVTLREILNSQEFRTSKSKLAFAVGKDIAGNCIVGDITKMPHVIIAGTTGSGKSVCTRSIIMSILYNAKPDEVKIILIDPKVVEFKIFEGLPHLLIPIITEAKKAAGALNWAVQEMMKRYNTFADLGANDLKSYNELADMDDSLEKMPQIVIFIDELADLMLVAGKEVEDSICRLAQMGRAAGMHLVVATQRPTTDVITGLIKANIPSRIALSVMSQVDSRTIIDMAGADRLLGNGDMLYMPIGMNKPIRIQGCFASTKDINVTLDFIKSQTTSEYDNSIIQAVENYTPQGKGGDSSGDKGFEAGSDEDYVERAIKVAVDAGQLSTSMLQRKLKLGYARAARIMDELEEMGVIGASEGAKPRRVLMSKMQYDERRLRLSEDQ